MPIATLFFDRTVNFFLGCPGNGGADDALRAGLPQGAGAGRQRGAGGADVIDQQYPFSGGVPGLIHVRYILPPGVSALQAGLGSAWS